jgi:hypothetical protein
MDKAGHKTMKRKDIQDVVYASQAFTSYKSASDKKKEEYYFSHNLKCECNGEKIDPDSLFSYSVSALKIKQALDSLCDLKYDLHILLVGTVLQPLMLSISAMNADNIILLYASDGTGQKKDVLAEYIFAYTSKKVECEAVNSSEPHTVFTAIKGIYDAEEWKGKKICIDITGGKKSMVGGGFLASSILGIDTFYIDFEKYENGKPVLCTEFLNKLDNPYDIFSIQLLNQAKELFRYHNYQAAYCIYLNIENKLSPCGLDKPEKLDLDLERSRVKRMKHVSECYMYWDRYAYNAAISCSEFIPEYQKSHLKNLQEFDEIPNKKSRYASVFFYDYILDRYLSAVRRGAYVVNNDPSGYHDAVLRYYQCVEMLLDAYITKHQKYAFYDPDVDKYPSKDIRRLCFSGYLEKKIDQKMVRYELSKKIELPLLNDKIANLNLWRDGFVHDKPGVQNSNIMKAQALVKQLIEIIFEKNESFKNDLIQYAFCTSFNDDGSLRKDHTGFVD